MVSFYAGEHFPGCADIVLGIDGRSDLALPLVSLASTMANSAGLYRKPVHSLERQTIEERRRCQWSIILLQRIFGQTPQGPDLGPPRTCSYPESPVLPPDAALTPTSPAQYSQESPNEGILVVVLRLSEAWSMAIAYVKDCFSSNKDLVPWMPTSKYNQALSSLMDISQQLPPRHRYRNLRIRDLATEELNRHRDYWAPWILSRFMYHTTMCLLNHPLLITLQLQGRRSLAELFLQQTLFHVSHHVRWILHLITYIKSRDFQVTDPIIGYCAAVVATIELQLSFSEDGPLDVEKKQHMDMCLDFVRSLSHKWPYMKLLVSPSCSTPPPQDVSSSVFNGEF